MFRFALIKLALIEDGFYKVVRILNWNTLPLLGVHRYLAKLILLKDRKNFLVASVLYNIRCFLTLEIIYHIKIG